jgi:hypothetical protein
VPGYKRYIALAMLLLFAASIAVSAQNDTNTCKSASLENESAGRPSITLVQEAANGTFVKNADGNYTLTLYNVVPYTMYYSDPPEQIAGFYPMESFVAAFKWRYSNASLSLLDADENEDTVILAISSPRYDNQTGTLTYMARIIEDPRDDRLSYQISRADAGIPERFGQAKITAGGCGTGKWACSKSETPGDCHAKNCGRIGIGCCISVGQMIGEIKCVPCGSECEYKAKCREAYGGICGDFHCADTCSILF